MVNNKTIALVKSFEGCTLSCVHIGDGVCTIGWGHTRPLSQCAGAGSWHITQAQADLWLMEELIAHENAVTSYFTRSFNDNQKGALTSFCYNLGAGIFKDYNFPKNGSDSQITSQMMLFLNKGTQFEAGITRRRKAEVALYNDGVVETNPTPTIGENEDMKLVQLINDGDYYGKKYPKNACFVTTGDSIRYIERPETLKILHQLCGATIPVDATDFLLYIQDMNLKFS